MPTTSSTIIPIASGIMSGQAMISSYRRNGKEVAVAPIDEVILIQGGAIPLGASKKLGLNTIPYVIRIDSMYFHSANPAHDNVTIQIVRDTEVLITQTIERASQLSLCNCYLVLLPGEDIVITPDSALTGFKLFAHQVVIIDNIVIN